MATSWHCARLTFDNWTPTAGIALVAMDSDVMPSPIRMQASSGSAAASPQTPTGLPISTPAAAVFSIRRSTAGCHGSVNVARLDDIRSAAIVYWVRSLVPIEKKSTSLRNACGMIATAGTSTMIPGVRSRSRHFCANS